MGGQQSRGEPVVVRRASSADGMTASNERKMFKLIELVSGLLVVVALQVSKTFPDNAACLETAMGVVVLNALAVGFAAWAGARNNSAIHEGVNQKDLFPSLKKQLTCRGTVYTKGFNPALSLGLPCVAALMQLSAVYVETKEPGVFEDWLAALSIALAMALPSLVECDLRFELYRPPAMARVMGRPLCVWWQDLLGVAAEHR